MPKIKWLSFLLASTLLAVPLAACNQSDGAASSGGATASVSATVPASDNASTTSPTASASETTAASPSAIPAETASPAPSASSTAKPSAAASESVQSALGMPTAFRMAGTKIGWTGGKGWIARTDDGGKTWHTQYKHDYEILQIFALNDQQAWATLDIGDSKAVKLVKSTDGGKNWSDAGNVPSYDFFHFVNEKEAFSGAWTTRDGGKSWQELSVPKGQVGNVYFHDRSNGWAVTQNAGQKFSFLRTQDGGKTWTSVYSKAWDGDLNGAVIRSAGKNDAWIELIGGSGMTQTSYSLFHTADDGKNWQPVVANSTAGAGPAPGFKMDDKGVPSNEGNSPGTLYVVDTKTAFLGGQCQACDNSNTLGYTTDGGKTWVNDKTQLPGYGKQLIAAADAKHVFWILTDAENPSVLYVSQDSGAHWTKTHTFAKPDGGTAQ
ncbi:YCF48-related protein [Cohnella sp. GCM10012308]|uniref:YCF48-related protein n=1 Tax=Cohnella sp. GCM10012308 TaxID=3317329 RepID=UPI003605AFB3